MANKNSFQIEGLSELSSSLDKIRKGLQAEAQYNALGAGALVLKKKARSLAPRREAGVKVKTRSGKNRRPGKLARSIVYQIYKYYSNPLALSAKGAYGILSVKDPVAHLVEYGHKTKLGSGKAKPRGRVPFVAPRPFMRPALDQSSGEAVDAVAKVLEEYFNK